MRASGHAPPGKAEADSSRVRPWGARWSIADRVLYGSSVPSCS